MSAAIVGVLLASGRGSRFDPSGAINKLLARLPDGRSVLRASADSLLAALAEVIVVVPPEHAALLPALEGLAVRIAVNPRHNEGMGTSLACGVAASRSAHGWLVALGDMPYVSSPTPAALRRALEDGAAIVAPCFEGQRGHPVGFAAHYRDELLALSGDFGARALLRNGNVVLVDVPDSGILSDIDTPGDLIR